MKRCAITLVSTLLVLSTGCALKSRRAHIVLGDVAVSAWDDNATVSTQIQLENTGGGAARQLRVTRLEVHGATYKGPPALPAALGDLAPGKDVLANGVVALAAANGTPRRLEVRGDYRQGDDRRHFRLHAVVRPDARPPAPITGSTGRTPKQNPGVPSPPLHPAPSSRTNAESPIFVPVGPPRQLFPPTPTGTTIQTAGGATFQIPRNTSMRSAGVPPDPNAAALSPTGVVLATYNTGISVSTDGGATFSDVALLSPQPGNPARTTFYPESDGGLCCDQVVVYLPDQNLFVWLMQYQPVQVCATNCGPPPPPPAVPPTPTFVITQANRLRIAWATPAAISSNFWNAWTYIDLTGPGLGTKNNEWMDYPDLAWSSTFLYVGVDHGNTTPGKVKGGRRIVARLSLADIVNTASPSVGYGFAELSGSNGLNKTHFVQNAPGRMVVGSLDNSSTLRVFTWNDSENTISPSTVAISQIQQGATYTSTAPDSSDWEAVSFPGNITGAVYRNVATGLGSPSRPEYLFAFDAGANPPGRPQAYVRLETLTTSGSNYSAFAEYDVWNPNFAFAMSSLGTDGTEIGLTIAVGGGTLGYPQHTVGYKDDFVVYQVTNSNATQTVRFGDYFGTRPIAGGQFATEVYDVILNPLPPGTTSGTCATVGCSANMRYVQFGRPPVIIK